MNNIVKNVIIGGCLLFAVVASQCAAKWNLMAEDWEECFQVTAQGDGDNTHDFVLYKKGENWIAVPQEDIRFTINPRKFGVIWGDYEYPKGRRWNAIISIGNSHWFFVGKQI